jgi:hypothetical protein
MRRANYDKYPATKLSGKALQGWNNITSFLKEKAGRKKVLAVDMYTGVHEEEVAEAFARKHDHVLIPGGTIHCSGADSMVLEISSTPSLFTFKLWDWQRLGLGATRPGYVE